MKWLIAVLFAGRVFACQVVDGDRITAKDLARANPVFATLDPALVIGASPLAGVQRVMHAGDIARIARANGIALQATPGEMCFERATESLTADELLPVLRNALGIDGASIEILDFSRYTVPKGTLEFTRAGLSSSGLWRGHVAYSQGRSSSIWVKTRITTEQTWVEAVEPLTAGKPVEAAQLTIRTGPRFPFGPVPLSSIDRATGRAPLRAIKTGDPLFASMLVPPREVERGESVHVEVVSGEAKLSFDATAESSGRAGDTVLIRNPGNGKFFQARVEAKGKVIVTR